VSGFEEVDERSLDRFITSSANNVPRITSLLHRLSTHFSAPLMTLPAPGYALGPSSGEEPTPYITYHLFPRPLDLLQPADGTNAVEQLETTLRGLGFGYRAGFISSSLNSLISAHGTPDERAAIGVPASEVEDGESVDTQGVEAFLHSLRRGGAKHPVSGEEDKWRGELLALKGVGRKVADCIGLMSLDRVRSTPVLCLLHAN
jgi:N-glycosylase/DNA lyase